jgi:hypothetical protein
VPNKQWNQQPNKEVATLQSMTSLLKRMLLALRPLQVRQRMTQTEGRWRRSLPMTKLLLPPEGLPMRPLSTTGWKTTCCHQLSRRRKRRVLPLRRRRKWQPRLPR